MFRFKLQVPLDYRKRQEEGAQMEFAKAERAVMEEKGHLSTLEQKYRDNANEYVESQESSLNIELIKMYRPYFQRIRFENRSQSLLIEEKKRVADAKREDLVEAVKKRKALELLKEKKEAAYKMNLLKREQKEMDEISASRYVRAKDDQ